jgi:serine/threonine protein kinase
MQKIKLPRGEWQFDQNAPLGKAGGFGEVFRGVGSTGNVAIKRLKLTANQAAHRELDIARNLKGRTLQNVVPILDAGQDAESDRYFIVMPVCDHSLQDVIDKEGENLGLDAALVALRAIVAGLLEVKDIVHRDLKPANVLCHEGVWKLADFGIAKFVEDSTSLETLRSSLTPLYAAPEQWRLERPTSATDVYALGCILHALTTAKPPFVGSLDRVRNAHLNSPRPAIATCPPRLATFASLMLRKLPDARPTLGRCREIFAESHIETKALSPARHALTQAAAEVEQRTAREDAERAQCEEAQKRRAALAKSAIADLKALVGNVSEEIKQSYERAKASHKGLLEFGFAQFGILREPEAIDQHWWHRGDLRSLVDRLRWDMVAWSTIGVTQSRQHSGGNYTWSSTLIYADRGDGAGYRWYEVAFFTSALSRRSGQRDEPYALEIHEVDFFQALSPTMHTVAVAYGPLAIDGENEGEFAERWLGLVAKAAAGQLERPRSMPVQDFRHARSGL